VCAYISMMICGNVLYFLTKSYKRYSLPSGVSTTVYDVSLGDFGASEIVEVPS
jgi:hypothetical protein